MCAGTFSTMNAGTNSPSLSELLYEQRLRGGESHHRRSCWSQVSPGPTRRSCKKSERASIVTWADVTSQAEIFRVIGGRFGARDPRRGRRRWRARRDVHVDRRSARRHVQLRLWHPVRVPLGRRQGRRRSGAGAIFEPFRGELFTATSRRRCLARRAANGGQAQRIARSGAWSADLHCSRTIPPRYSPLRPADRSTPPLHQGRPGWIAGAVPGLRRRRADRRLLRATPTYVGTSPPAD